jgi:hypothetical protein
MHSIHASSIPLFCKFGVDDVAKTNYAYEKRQRELAKKQKKEAKRQKQLAAGHESGVEASPPTTSTPVAPVRTTDV